MSRYGPVTLEKGHDLGQTCQSSENYDSEMSGFSEKKEVILLQP